MPVARRLQNYFPLMLLPLLLLLFVACGGKQKAPPPMVMPVKAVAAVGKSVPQVIEAVGTVEPEESAAVRAQAGGLVQAIHFKEGQEVKAGDLLVTLDARPYQATLHQAEAQLARDAAQAKNAAEQAERYADLVKKEYVTQEQYDAIRTSAAALKAAAAADASGVENARLQLNYCSLRAPISGRTGSLLVRVGNLVKANDDKPLLIINRIHPLRVAFAVPQNRLSEIKRRSAAEGLQVSARPGDDPGAPLSRGTLSFIDNAVDTASGTIALKATFANADNALWPGQFVNVKLDLSRRENAVVVPEEALQNGQGGEFVFVVKADQTVEMRPVKSSLRVGREVVLDEGVQAGEMVVTDGQLRLSPGARVEVTQTPSPSPNPNSAAAAPAPAQAAP